MGELTRQVEIGFSATLSGERKVNYVDFMYYKGREPIRFYGQWVHQQNAEKNRPGYYRNSVHPNIISYSVIGSGAAARYREDYELSNKKATEEEKDHTYSRKPKQKASKSLGWEVANAKETDVAPLQHNDHTYALRPELEFSCVPKRKLDTTYFAKPKLKPAKVLKSEFNTNSISKRELNTSSVPKRKTRTANISERQLKTASVAEPEIHTASIQKSQRKATNTMNRKLKATNVSEPRLDTRNVPKPKFEITRTTRREDKIAKGSGKLDEIIAALKRKLETTNESAVVSKQNSDHSYSLKPQFETTTTSNRIIGTANAIKRKRKTSSVSKHEIEIENVPKPELYATRVTQRKLPTVNVPKFELKTISIPKPKNETGFGKRRYRKKSILPKGG